MEKDREKEKDNDKESVKCNVLSIRVTNQEKAAIEKITRETEKSVTMLIREAMRHYTSCIE